MCFGGGGSGSKAPSEPPPAALQAAVVGNVDKPRPLSTQNGQNGNVFTSVLGDQQQTYVGPK